MENAGRADRKSDKGRLFVLSAPSGAGKTTLCRALLKRFPDIRYSVSHTTRAPRKGEVDGRDYFFVDTKTFQDKLEKGLWAEWAEVHGNFYGTSDEFLESCMANGVDVLLDIDVQGARQIVRRHPDCVTVFVMPPSLSELRKRLEKRATDSREVVERRLADAGQEIAGSRFYRHVIVNDDLDEAVGRLIGLVERYR